MIDRIGLLGNGGQADEAEDFAVDRVVFRAVDSRFRHDGATEPVDVERPPEQFVQLPVVAAVGAPGTKRRLLAQWPGSRYATIVAEGARVSPRAIVGRGCIIAPGADVSVTARVGDHVIVNVAASVAHDAIVGDFSTVGPGARIGGRVIIGSGVVVGIGATVRNGITIADGVLIGAGAVVVADVVEPNAVVAGNPARVLRVADGWADEL